MSGTRKDAPFVSSVGRVQGTRISRDNSGESLASHPLLSPPPGSVSSANAVTATTSDTKASTLKPPESPPNGNSPKYVPYTPRHRVSTSQVTAQYSSATLGTTGGGATPQLQLQNLKAAAQNAQLNSNSVGWAICEKLYQEGESPEWEDIWSAVVQNKATLLLPLDPVTPQEVITADYVRDHVVYCTAPSNKVIPVVTLSGLRGNTLTLRSVIATTAPHFQALAALNSRVSALAALPPLPSPLIVPLKPEYPVFNIPAPQTELPFPSQPQHKPQARPGLTAARLNPFASLFGVRASPASTPIALPSTPTSEESEGRSPSVNVSVYVIQGRIIKKDV
ncbi:7370_t:CDS:2, partial [Acaulospora colombiana]